MNFKIEKIILFTFISFIATSAIVSWYYDFRYFAGSDELEIEYKGLTQEQINYTNFLVENLNPLYTQKTNKIIFSNNITSQEVCGWHPWCKRALKKYCTGVGCYGINDPQKGWLYINMRYPLSDIEDSLCHELLHNFVEFGSNEIKNSFHQIIYDLADRRVCYTYTQNMKGGVN